MYYFFWSWDKWHEETKSGPLTAGTISWSDVPSLRMGGVRVAVTKEIWPLVCRNNQCFVDWLECLSCRGISEQVRLAMATCFSRSLSISSLLLCGISSATRHDELPVIVIMHHACTIRVIYRSPFLYSTASATVTNGSKTSRFSICIKSIKRIIPDHVEHLRNSIRTFITDVYHRRFES